MFNYIYTPKSGSKIVSGQNGEMGPFCLTLTNGSHFLVGGVMLPIRRANGHRVSRGLAVRVAQSALKRFEQREMGGFVLDQNGDISLYVHSYMVEEILKALHQIRSVADRVGMDTDGIDLGDAEIAAEITGALPIKSLQYRSEGDFINPSHWVFEARYEDFSMASQKVPAHLVGELLGIIDDLGMGSFKAGPVPSGLYREGDCGDSVGELVIRPIGMGEIEDEEV